ncbi:DUF4885 family protein [Viridibacillus soli]|uniref:DUF4885 family protein n=1 Tax=Viridibacillus soli TaxID=2798301 RepID=UPI0022777785|nr:DUF4885 family protein [Viridibacillus soli]
MNINAISTPFITTTSTKQIVQDKTITGDKGEPSNQSKNDWTSESEKRMKILDEKYRKINEQNKQFKNPFAHISDKYRNPKSPYFRSDLTEAERKAAMTMEMTWARHGSGGQYDFWDAAFRNELPIYMGVEEVERRAFNREKVNGQLNGLFAKNGITIPNGTNLTFTIDPNHFKLMVGGTQKIYHSLLN